MPQGKEASNPGVYPGNVGESVLQADIDDPPGASQWQQKSQLKFKITILVCLV